MNRVRFSIVALVALACGPPFTLAQQPPSQIPLAPPALVGSVENSGGQLRLNLTNTDLSRGFRGTAQISLGNVMEQAEAGKLAVALAPEESRLFPLTAVTASGDQYALRIYDQNGALIFYKVAPIKRLFDEAKPVLTAVSEGPAATTPPSPSPSAKEVEVKPRLAGGESETAPFVLAFEVASQKPLLNATLSVNAKGFQQRQVVNVQGRINVEFKLPDELEERKVGYTLTNAAGQVMARGVADLDQLLTDDYISVSEVKLDRPAYTLGETARVTVSLQGGAQRSFRLEVTAKDGRGNIFFRDARKGANEGGKSNQEFAVPLPRETPGPLIFEFKLYEAETGTLFDSGEREIALTGTGGGVSDTR